MLILLETVLSNRVNSFRTTESDNDSENDNDSDSDDEIDGGDANSAVFYCPTRLEPVGRDPKGLVLSGGRLPWVAISNTPSQTTLRVRYYSSRLFVVLDDACPPLQWFIDTTDTNYSHRRAELRKFGWYCETDHNGRGGMCVIEWDAFLWLLDIRNKQCIKGLRCVPAAPYDDKTELHRWVHWARQIPYSPLCPRQPSAMTSTATKDNQIGQKNRKARGAGRKALSTWSALEAAAQTVLRRVSLKTEAQKVQAVASLMIECQKEGMTYALDEWKRQVRDPDRRLPLHLLTGITNQSAKRVRQILCGLSSTEAKTEKQQRAIRTRAEIPKRFRSRENDEDGEEPIETVVQDAVMDVAERVWAAHSDLRAQYGTIRSACEHNFALSKACPRFWQTLLAEMHHSEEMPSGLLGMCEEATDRRILRAIVEKACGSTFERRERSYRYQMAVQHPDGWRVLVPNLLEDYEVSKREADLASRCVGELHINPDHDPDNPSAADPVPAFNDDINMKSRVLLAPGKARPTSNPADIVKELDKGTYGALLVGAERKLVVERDAPKSTSPESDESDEDEEDQLLENIERWFRIHDTTYLTVQWVVLNAGAFLGEGNVRLTVGLEMWIDGTTIGGRPTIAVYMLVRPIGNAEVGDGPDAADRLMDSEKRNEYLKNRLVCLCEDTRETREVYEKLIALLCVQLRATTDSTLKVRLKNRRTITLDVQVEPIRGDFHAQQAWNGLNMSGRWTCPYSFVRASNFANFSAHCDQIERKLAVTPGKGMNDWQDIYNIAQAWERARESGEPQDLGYVIVGGGTKHSQVHGPAPCFLDAHRAANPISLNRMGFKTSSLAPDPEHCMHATIKAVFFEFANKLPEKGKAELKANVKEATGRETYEKYMDGSNWRAVCAGYETILIPVLQKYAGAVPEARILFRRLKQLDEIVHLSRADISKHVCLRCKLASYEYTQLIEHLVRTEYFESRPVGLYHTYLSVFLPYTIGTDRSKGQVVPSEGSTQATEARWAHLRRLYHRSERRGGRPWLLEAFVDDQVHLVYGDEYLLPEDLRAERGQSLVSKELREVELQGRTRDVDLNTRIAKWVLELPKAAENWRRFEKLFLQPEQCGAFKLADDYCTHRGCVIGRTAADPARRVALNRHLEQESLAPSQRTTVDKTVQLLLEPPAGVGDSDMRLPGVAALCFRTQTTETVGDAAPVRRKPRIICQDIGVTQLRQLVRAFREQAGVDTAGVSAMIAGEGSNGVGTGLRNELWRWAAEAHLPDSLLQQILQDDVTGFDWVTCSPPASARTAPAATPQNTAPGWVATWSARLGSYLYRNSSGVASTVNPVETSSSEVDTEGPQTTTQVQRATRSRSNTDSPRDAPPRARQQVRR